MALPLKSTIYTIYVVVLIALGVLLSQSVRQYQLHREHESIITQTERLIFQYSIIREHVSDALLDREKLELSGIATEMEKLHSNLAAILEDKHIGDEYKLTFINSIDLPGIIFLLRQIEGGKDDIDSIRNLNREMRTLGERLILFDRVLVNNAKHKLIGFQNIIIGSSAVIVFLLVTVLALFHRQLVIPLLELIRESGDAVTGEAETVPITGKSLEVASMATSVSRFIHQRKDLQLQLQNHTIVGREIIGALEGVWVQISKEETIEDLNEELAEKCGFQRDELIGRNWQDLFLLPEDFSHETDSEMSIIEEMSRTEKAITFSLRTKSDKPRKVRCCFIEYPSEDTKSFQIHCFGYDITEYRNLIAHLEEELQQERNKKVEMVRVSHLAVLGEISTGVAHEVSNLSNGIINYAQVLADASCDPDLELERDEMFNKIIVEGEKIAAIAKNLLAYGQDDADSRELAPIDEVMENSLALMQHYFKIDGTTVDVDLKNLPRSKANGRQMQQVFLNILNNARRALNERYPQKDVKKILRIQGDTFDDDGRAMLRLSFTDLGTGISEDNISKVFDPSFSTKPASEGVGLGLTVSRELVEQQQGRILLESEENDHTTVTIEMPVR